MYCEEHINFVAGGCIGWVAKALGLVGMPTEVDYQEV
jgi:hypothetical protein